MANEVFNLNSNLFPCICVAMYETILSPSVFEESLNDGADQYDYYNVDFADWKTKLNKVAQDYLDEHVIDSLKNYGVISIEADGIWSPKYYNYHQDELNMNVTMAEDWKTTMQANIDAWRGREDVAEYISTYWRSYDGYVNYMAESLDELLNDDDEDRQLAGYLTLAMLVEGTLRPYRDVLEDLYYMMEDFSDWTSGNVIADHYDKQDEANKLLKLYNSDDDWNELYWSLAHKIGFRWLHEGPDRLDSKNYMASFYAKSDGERLLFWAVDQELTVEDLKKLAA